jgi:hypothetical protein
VDVSRGHGGRHGTATRDSKAEAAQRRVPLGHVLVTCLPRRFRGNPAADSDSDSVTVTRTPSPADFSGPADSVRVRRTRTRDRDSDSERPGINPVRHGGSFRSHTGGIETPVRRLGLGGRTEPQPSKALSASDRRGRRDRLGPADCGTGNFESRPGSRSESYRRG